VRIDKLKHVGSEAPSDSHFFDFGLIFYAYGHNYWGLKSLLQQQFYVIKRALNEQSLLIRTRADTCAGVSTDHIGGSAHGARGGQTPIGDTNV